MTNNCESLIEMINNSDGSFDPDEEEFAPVFHELYENDDSEGMKELLDSFAKFHFRTKNYKTYDHAFAKAREDLDSFTEDAEDLFGDKGIIRKFYRQAVDYDKQDRGFSHDFSLN